jgi:hypothetical protein
MTNCAVLKTLVLNVRESLVRKTEEKQNNAVTQQRYAVAIYLSLLFLHN